MLTRSGRKRVVSKGSGDNVAPAAKRTGVHPNMSRSAGVSSSSTESAVSTVLQNLEVVSTAQVTTTATSTDPATQSDFNMETLIPSCGACNLQDITSRSIVWCTECEEGLCPECLKHHSNSKASRHHNPVPMTVFQEINQTCDQHNAEYTIYCTAHACLCCSSCIVESHIECQKIAKLANILQNTESLIAFDEIEHSLAELTDNIQRIRESRQNNLGTLSERKSQIEKEIKQTRITINTHLDKMQDDMMKQLHATEEEEIKQIGRLLNSLTEKENEIIECQAKLEKFKQTATNLKTFISMKQLEQDISSKRELFYSMIDSESFKDRELSYHAHASLQKIATDITNYGELITKKIPCNVFLKRTKNKQTKRMVPHSLCSNTTMETSDSFCGACNVQHITSISVVWCTECDEGLCPECKTYHCMLKASRYHNTVPITVYQESDVQEIKSNM
ncbi:Hypothetical predicted protein [Mytilus galloprovincialis]|uniref:B box-type domain-containing protein n=1 Tax=Mytilus galloprovincialis TaxID=29158 RepID=A0A8B6BQB4_MYTGA|nr:Hypothetical predicted protein [Mytilus galloprovincialis]